MENPRPQKVAVVTEVRERLDAADAAILTEYRGLTVAELAELRQALRAAGGDYKVYKNTLVKLAIAGGRHEALGPLLEGPTAIAFVSGEVSAAAKALRDYARTYPNLVIKGGPPRGRVPVDPGAGRPGRPALARRAPGAAGRDHRRPPPPVRRPLAGASPQPRLRDVGPARRAWRCPRRGRARTRSPAAEAETTTEADAPRPTPPAEADVPAEADATASARGLTAEAEATRRGRGVRRTGGSGRDRPRGGLSRPRPLPDPLTIEQRKGAEPPWLPRSAKTTSSRGSPTSRSSSSPSS